jgi:hypothetical protein
MAKKRLKNNSMPIGKWHEHCYFTPDRPKKKAHFVGVSHGASEHTTFYDIYLFELDNTTFLVRKVFGNHEWWKINECIEKNMNLAEVGYDEMFRQRMSKSGYWKLKEQTIRTDIYGDVVHYRPMHGQKEEIDSTHDPDSTTNAILKDLGLNVEKANGFIIVKCSGFEARVPFMGADDVEDICDGLACKIIPNLVVGDMLPLEQMVKTTNALKNMIREIVNA